MDHETIKTSTKFRIAITAHRRCLSFSEFDSLCDLSQAIIQSKSEASILLAKLLVLIISITHPLSPLSYLGVEQQGRVYTLTYESGESVD